MNETTKSIFIDIDGTLIHQTSGERGIQSNIVLPGVFARFKEWYDKGYTIVLTTARRESLRRATEDQLTSLGLSWDHLIMGVGGTRVLINNFSRSSDEPRAVAINLTINTGLEGVNL